MGWITPSRAGRVPIGPRTIGGQNAILRSLHEEAQREFFERLADHYDRRLCRSRWPRNLTLKARLISSVLGEAVDKRIVEIGCGTGHIAEQLLAAHPRLRYVGVDLSPAMLDVARNRLAPYSDRVTLMLASDDPVAYGDSFAAAFGVDVLHHVAEPVELLRGLASALRPDAPVVFLEANALFPLNAADRPHLEKEERGVFTIRPENLRRWFNAAAVLERRMFPPSDRSIHLRVHRGSTVRSMQLIGLLARTPLLRALALQLVARGRTTTA